MAERDPKTEWLRVQLYRRMTPQQRIEIAAQLYDDGVGIVRSSILDRNPNIAPDVLQREIRRRVLPRGMAEARKPSSPGRSAPPRGRPQGGKAKGSLAPAGEGASERGTGKRRDAAPKPPVAKAPQTAQRRRGAKLPSPLHGEAVVLPKARGKG
jgi:hypothetical protein